MAHKPLNDEEISELSSNPYVASISLGRVTFTPEFKRIAYDLLMKGTPIREIFGMHGIDPDILGKVRLLGFVHMLRANADQGFEDHRKLNCRMPAMQTREQTLEARVEQLEHELAYTRQEVEFLKKYNWPIWRLGKNGNPSSARSEMAEYLASH